VGRVPTALEAPDREVRPPARGAVPSSPVNQDPLDLVRAALERAPGHVVAAYIFGSVARGTAGPRSDVDVAILEARNPEPSYAALPLRLAGDLERALGRRVDVVVLNVAPVDLVHRVLRDGVLVLERDRSLRIAFEVRARNAYFDLLPVLREYRRGRSAA
jgi:predicted nucleotidyltransferase